MDFKVNRLEHHQSRMFAALTSPLHKPRSGLHKSLADWRSFRSQFTRQRPDLSHYQDLQQFRLPERPRRRLHYSLSRSSSRSLSTSSLLGSREVTELEACVSFGALKKASRFIRKPETWEGLTEAYQQELVKFCQAVLQRTGTK